MEDQKLDYRNAQVYKTKHTAAHQIVKKTNFKTNTLVIPSVKKIYIANYFIQYLLYLQSIFLKLLIYDYY